MNNGFAKLDGGIVDSTLWMQPHDVLRVWIAMLAKCDSYGLVRASVPSMAHLCMVPIERLEQIFQLLTSPDQYSRSSDDDGRRLRVIEGGWLIINYVKYRELVQTKAQSHAERQRKYRERLTERDKRVTGDVSVTRSVTSDTEAEAEAEAVNQETSNSNELLAESPSDSAESSPCPVRKIVELYHVVLPELRSVEKITAARRAAVSQRWREDLPTLESWESYFKDIRGSPFLMGRTKPGAGRDAPFVADFEWLVKAGNFAKVAERKYHR